MHRLEEGGNLHGFLPKSYPVYPDLLEEAGYVVGYTGKGWGPGRFEAGGRTRNPAGPLFKSFDEFMERRAKGSPFCFWFGSTDPHRPYEPGTGAQSGMKPERVQVPGFLPDTAEVRNDLLDYYFEVQRFDRDLGRIIEALERAGELENTIVIVTSDNGMPFPRAKANVYDGGARVPLVIRWPGVSRAGTVDRVVRQPHRSGAHDSGRRGDHAARRDDRTQPAASLARRIPGTRSRLHRTGAPCERAAKAI